jgi:exopolysaccharide production protein ExoQ
MNGLVMIDSHHDRPAAKIPWLIFLFLAIVFFVANHDWFFSLKGGEDFGTTVDEFTTVVEKGNLLRRVIFLSLGVFGAAFLLNKGRYKLMVKGSLGWLSLLLFCWALLSCVWTEESILTVRRLVLIVMFILAALAVSQRFSPRDLIFWVFFSTVIYLNVGLAAETALGTFHPLTGGYRFAGTLHPNSQGINCALLFFASLFLLNSERRWRVLLLAIALESLAFLVLTKSRTSLACAIITLLLYWLATLPLSRKVAVLLGLAFVVTLVLLVGPFILPSIERVVDLGRGDSDSLTLTGRIPLWEQMLPYILERPVQGYGYDSFWTARHIVEIAKGQNWAVSQGHSAYLDLTLGLGLIGGFVFILIVIVVIRRAFLAQKLSRNMAFGFMGVVLLFSALDGFLESIVIMTNQVAFVNMVALAILGFSSQRQTKEAGLSWRRSI